MKHLCCFLFVTSLLLVCMPVAYAQGSADVNIGFGSAHAKSNGSGIDNIYSANAFGSCIPGLGDPFCQATPGLNGFLLGFGGDGMFAKRFGVGGEVSFMPSKGDYGPLQFRQIFYDFNGIYMPVNEKRVGLKLMGGIGGARTSFSFNQSSCVGTAVCSSSSTPVGGSNHFQLHVGAGVEILLTEHMFIRPQFDLRYIPNFTDQFGSNIVPGGMLWIGLKTGGR